MPKVVPEYKEKARQRIIEAGANVFIERGYYKTKVEDIADAIGVSKGAIYQYFKSKEQLFFEVMEFVLESQKDEVMSIILSEDPMRIATGEFFESRASKALQTRSFGFDLLLEASKNDALGARIAEIYEMSYGEFRAQIESMKKQGKIRRSVDVSVIWRGLVALRDGLTISLLFGADMSDAKKTWEEIATVLLKGIFAKNTTVNR